MSEPILNSSRPLRQSTKQHVIGYVCELVRQVEAQSGSPGAKNRAGLLRQLAEYIGVLDSRNSQELAAFEHINVSREGWVPGPKARQVLAGLGGPYGSDSHTPPEIVAEVISVSLDDVRTRTHTHIEETSRQAARAEIEKRTTRLEEATAEAQQTAEKAKAEADELRSQLVEERKLVRHLRDEAEARQGALDALNPDKPKKPPAKRQKTKTAA